jgi:pilus assembly protein Flp/PilA
LEVIMRGVRRERGASAVEYGLLIAGIAALIAVAVFAVGRISGQQMGDGCDTIGGAMATALSSVNAPNCTN